MGSRAHTVTITFMVENDLNQKETRKLFQELIGSNTYSNGPKPQESTALRDFLKQYGLLPLKEAPTYAHLGNASHNAYMWERIKETREQASRQAKIDALVAAKLEEKDATASP